MVGIGARLREADDLARVVDRVRGCLWAAQRPDVGHRAVAPHPGALHALPVVAAAGYFVRLVDPGRVGEDASLAGKQPRSVIFPFCHRTASVWPSPGMLMEPAITPDSLIAAGPKEPIPVIFPLRNRQASLPLFVCAEPTTSPRSLMAVPSL